MAAVDEILFEVETDQNATESADALGGYEASDLMWAKAEKVAQTDGVVNLQFHHMMFQQSQQTHFRRLLHPHKHYRYQVFE